MKNIVRGIIGIVLIIAVIMIPIYWENYGRELTMSEVVAFNKDIQKNTVVTRDMIKLIKIEDDKKLEGVITDPNRIINKETKNFIPKNCQLVKQFFDISNLVLEEDEYIFKIPSQWLESFPSTLRRGDKIYLYEIKESQIDTFENIKEKTPICSAIVAYVKDNSNREVTTINEDNKASIGSISESNQDNSVNKSQKSRYYGSSNVNEIEIIVNQDLVNKLYSSVSNNNKFIIYYN